MNKLTFEEWRDKYLVTISKEALDHLRKTYNIEDPEGLILHMQKNAYKLYECGVFDSDPKATRRHKTMTRPQKPTINWHKTNYGLCTNCGEILKKITQHNGTWTCKDCLDNNHWQQWEKYTDQLENELKQLRQNNG